MVSWTIILQAVGFGLVTAAIVGIGSMGFTLQFGVTNILNIPRELILTVGALPSLIAPAATPTNCSPLLIIAASARGRNCHLGVGTDRVCRVRASSGRCV